MCASYPLRDVFGSPFRRIDFELVDPESGELQALADLAWPEGVQEGLTDPVAFLTEPDSEMEERLNELGYRFFTSEERLIWYLEKLVGVDIDGDGVLGEPDPPAEGAELKAPGDRPPVQGGDVDLEKQWDQEMASIYRRAKAEAGYNATYFLEMLSQRGGLETARYLLHTNAPSEGFTHQWERGRIDLTVEAHVLAEECKPLYTAEELRIAKGRLVEYGYPVDG